MQDLDLPWEGASFVHSDTAQGAPFVHSDTGQGAQIVDSDEEGASRVGGGNAGEGPDGFRRVVPGWGSTDGGSGDVSGSGDDDTREEGVFGQASGGGEGAPSGGGEGAPGGGKGAPGGGKGAVAARVEVGIASFRAKRGQLERC